MKTTDSSLKQLVQECPTPQSRSISTATQMLQPHNKTMKQYHPQTQHLPLMYNPADTSNTPGKLMIPTKSYMMAKSFEKKDQSWCAVSDIPTDLSIKVEDITFYVHKYAVLSKSGYIGRVDLHPTDSDFRYDIKLDNFPGGAVTFEVVLKFCYGLPIDLSPNNVAPLRCASELLEMTEEFEEGNLISKTEAFLTFIVLASWRDSIMVLKTCENLSPWAENLQIVRRCCDSISGKALQEKRTIGDLNDERIWWFDDVANLRIDHFVRIVTALKSKGIRPVITGYCIKHYAEKWLPAREEDVLGEKEHWCDSNELQLSIVNGGIQEGPISQYKEQKMIIESLVSILPPQKEAVPCKFILWMLKMAIIYSITPALISELEKRAGLVLLDATVQDLLIPRCNNRGKPISSPEEKTMYSTDTIQRIVEYFLMQEQQNQNFEKLDVSRLLDNYLAEIATDPNLSISTFQALAEALPEKARICHDGLYRAIDVYLKTHPFLQEHDRKRLCKLMSCQKLSFDACMHIAQNDRLPLKTVIQVLFAEQAKMRAAMQTKEQVVDVDENEGEGEESWSSAKKEINVLKTELEKVKETMSELVRDYSELQREYVKQIHKQQNTSSWILGWRKIINAASFNGKVEAESGEDKKNYQRRSSSLRRRQSIS